MISIPYKRIYTCNIVFIWAYTYTHTKLNKWILYSHIYKLNSMLKWFISNFSSNRNRYAEAIRFKSIYASLTDVLMLKLVYRFVSSSGWQRLMNKSKYQNEQISSVACCSISLSVLSTIWRQSRIDSYYSQYIWGRKLAHSMPKLPFLGIIHFNRRTDDDRCPFLNQSTDYNGIISSHP